MNSAEGGFTSAWTGLQASRACSTDQPFRHALLLGVVRGGASKWAPERTAGRERGRGSYRSHTPTVASCAFFREPEFPRDQVSTKPGQLHLVARTGRKGHLVV